MDFPWQSEKQLSFAIGTDNYCALAIPKLLVKVIMTKEESQSQGVSNADSLVWGTQKMPLQGPPSSGIPQPGSGNYILDA